MIQKFFLDRPLKDIRYDELEISDFVKRISTIIADHPMQESLVIGLYGDWGSGKTTLLNFIKLSEQIKSSIEKEELIVMDFAPWLISGHKDLIQEYLVELSKKLSPFSHRVRKYSNSALKGVDSILEALPETILNYAQLVTPISGSTHFARNLLQKGIRKLLNEKSLLHQKQEVEDLLKKSKKKILVVIDDIDRLETTEILDILKMVKSVGNFSNIIYLLSFDKKLVCNAILKSQNLDAESYLEKIVQLGINIPSVNTTKIFEIFTRRINLVTEGLVYNRWYHNRWSTLSDYLYNKLDTPRKAIRLSSNFSMKYFPLINKVDPIDFLAIESLQMFNIDIFLEISKNKFNFIDNKSKRVYEKKGSKLELKKNEEVKAEYKSYIQKVLSLIPTKEQEIIKNVITILFPRVEEAFDWINEILPIEILGRQLQGRISSIAHFRTYFDYMPVTNQISYLKFRQENFNNLADFKILIFEYRSHIKEFIEYIENMIRKEQNKELLEGVIRSLLEVGDLIIQEIEDNSTYSVSSKRHTILNIILDSLSKLKSADIFYILKSSYQKTESLLLSMYLLREVYSRSNKSNRERLYLGEKSYLTLKQFKKLEKIILKKIHIFAEQDSFLDNILIGEILCQWCYFEENFEIVETWIEKATSLDEHFIKLLRSLFTVRAKEENNNMLAKKYRKFFPNFNKIFDRIRSILKKNKISGKEKMFLEEVLNLEAFPEKYNVRKSS